MAIAFEKKKQHKVVWYKIVIGNMIKNYPNARLYDWLLV